MRTLLFLFKTSPAVLLLVLCLRLGSGAAQDLVQEVISAKLTIDPVENSTNYYDVTVTVKSYVAKCLVVRVTLEAFSNIIFPYENGIIKGKAEVVSEENICPSDVEICSLVYKVCIKREIIIRC
ncbi:prolactin-inducible protein homolog isoform X3 [Bos indicus]|uniref:Prolactin-inducible protein homolog isoform X3 n=1 Tax=Bos indicus TaxID=9915 RepID=A0ABM4S9C3_BOSIN